MNTKFEPKALTICEFCESHRISRSLFYKLEDEGLAPRSFKIGTRRLIPVEAAREWRQFMWERFPASRVDDALAALREARR